MRLKYKQAKKGRCYYIIRSVYRNGKNTSETYRKLGYLEDIKKKHGCADPENGCTTTCRHSMKRNSYSPCPNGTVHGLFRDSPGHLYQQRRQKRTADTGLPGRKDPAGF